MPRVSIGLPTYNRAALLPRALDALLGQEYGDFELVVCDNASADGTEEVARAYAARDRRVRYVRQPNNVGVLGNFARALDEARGEYFMWAADDDAWSPRYVSTLAARLERHPEVALCAAEVQRVDPEGRPLPSPAEGRPFYELVPGRSRFGRLWVAVRSHAANQVYGLFRRDALARPRNAYWALQKHGCYCEIPIFLRAAAAGQVLVVPERLMTKRYPAPTRVGGVAAMRYAVRFERRAMRSVADELCLLCPPGPARAALLAYCWYRIRVADLARTIWGAARA